MRDLTEFQRLSARLQGAREAGETILLDFHDIEPDRIEGMMAAWNVWLSRLRLHEINLERAVNMADDGGSGKPDDPGLLQQWDAVRIREILDCRRMAFEFARDSGFPELIEKTEKELSQAEKTCHIALARLRVDRS